MEFDMQTFTFNIEQIKDIYRAGIRRGENTATAFEWGSTASGKEFDDCIDAIHDIVNDGKKFTDTDYTSFSDVAKWFERT